MQHTLSIVKPNAVNNHHIGEIITMFEEENLRIAGMKLVKINPEKAKVFYEEHEQKPFFNELITFITSGPVVLIVLEGKNAIEHNRTIMGATDPAKAAEGTIRNLYAESMQANAVHGSDSETSARREIALFFEDGELF
jgi:nucleoside-diphosphate kinase